MNLYQQMYCCRSSHLFCPLLLFKSNVQAHTHTQALMIHESSIMLQPPNPNSLSLETCILLFDALMKDNDVGSIVTTMSVQTSDACNLGLYTGNNGG